MWLMLRPLTMQPLLGPGLRGGAGLQPPAPDLRPPRQVLQDGAVCARPSWVLWPLLASAEVVLPGAQPGALLPAVALQRLLVLEATASQLEMWSGKCNTWAFASQRGVELRRNKKCSALA